MSQSLLYAKSLSLLLEEIEAASDLTMLRSSLLRVRRFSRSHALAISMHDGQMSINGIRLQRPLPTLRRVTHAMSVHGIGELRLEAGASPRELLELAMMLARDPMRDPGAPALLDALRYASLWCVQAYPVARSAPTSNDAAFVADAAMIKFDDVVERTKVLAEQAASARQAGDAAALAHALATLAAVEAKVPNAELRARWTGAFIAAADSEAVRLIVAALPTCRDTLDISIAALRRVGKAAATILIEQLLTSESMDVRRACFDALCTLRCGTDEIVKLLTHEQWFVVRNATCLLGAFQSRSSEPELTQCLAHTDERVRAAAVTSLLQLDTRASRQTVRGAIRDISPEVRRRAVRAFLAEEGSANVDELLQALESETDPDVQLEFLYAMGTLGSSSAVQHLIRFCSPEGRNRSVEFRIAAAEALTSARLGAAVPLLKAMLKDPDLHARAAARHLIKAVS